MNSEFLSLKMKFVNDLIFEILPWKGRQYDYGINVSTTHLDEYYAQMHAHVHVYSSYLELGNVWLPDKFLITLTELNR